MKQPDLKTSKDGHQMLYIFYDNNHANLDQEIERVERHFNVIDDATVTVIPLPIKTSTDGVKL